jgi:hypothetical protein
MSTKAPSRSWISWPFHGAAGPASASSPAKHFFLRTTRKHYLQLRNCRVEGRGGQAHRLHLHVHAACPARCRRREAASRAAPQLAGLLQQKAVEVKTLVSYLAEPASAKAAIKEATAVIASRAAAEGVRRADIRARTDALTAADFSRSDYSVREAAQEEALNLSPLPTTIGSFPQTAEIRSARARNNKGALTDEQYEKLMKDEIKRVVELQEELGYDGLVHGEPERNDMVQYFAENLEGFDVTVHGWIQSYGSRCTVRPSSGATSPAAPPSRWPGPSTHSPSPPSR